MIPRVQIIEEDGKPRFAVIDYHVLRKLEELIEDALDVKEAEKILNAKTTSWKDFKEVKEKLLANPIKEKRMETGFTQGKLAKRMNVHQSFVAKIERADYNPSKQTLLKVAKALGCRVEELF